MTEANSVGRQFFEAQDRLRGLDREIVTVDYTADLNGMQMDFDTHKEFTADLYAAFPDLKQVIESIDVAPAAERVRLRLVGTHSGTFNGIEATGKAIDVEADVILMIEDGKVESVVGKFDQVSLLKQLGVE
jgi:predicted ester cyclase